jgi:SPP1 family predicted phage head-tail adaptor
MRKDKKITIMEYTDGELNQLGERTQELTPLHGGEDIWAYYRHLSGNEFFAAATTNSKVEALFQIAWRNDIDTWMIIRYKNKNYNITNIDDFEGNKENLKIYAYSIN